MKKLNALGKALSRGQMKQITGGVATNWLCSCCPTGSILGCNGIFKRTTSGEYPMSPCQFPYPELVCSEMGGDA